MFVHGSFGWGHETWREQRPLGDTYRLLLVDRRGFGGSAPNGRVDFERDAADVAGLIDERTHLVGHSYGGVVALLAAARRPRAIRSLTVIEPPALGLARGNPAVEALIAEIRSASTAAIDPSDYRARFLRAFGFHPERVRLKGLELEAARSSMTERPPWEAQIPLATLAGTGIPTLVVRGDWSAAPTSARERGGAAFHAVCDELESRLGAERAVFRSAHNPQLLGTPFNERLRRFWETAG